MAAKKKNKQAKQPQVVIPEMPQMTAEEATAAAYMALGQAPTAAAATGVTPAAPQQPITEPYVAAAYTALGQPANIAAATGNSQLASGTPQETAPMQETAPTAPMQETAPTAGGTTGGATNETPQTQVPTGADTGPDAEQIIKALLQGVGLGDLADVIWKAIGETKISSATSVDQIGFMIRDTEPYKKRFAGNVTRRDANLAEYSITEYLNLETAYRNAIQGSGLPAGFYDSPEYYSQFIGGNVSPAEVKRRVDEGYRAIKNADPQVLAQLKQYYPSVGNGELAAFFLDPTVTTDIIVNRARAAEIGAQATLQAGMAISADQAEYLRQQGVSQETAQQAFGSIAMQRGLYEPQMAGEQAVDVQTQIEAATGVRAEAVQRVETRRRKRKAEFEAGGAFAAGQAGVAGLGTANR